MMPAYAAQFATNLDGGAAAAVAAAANAANVPPGGSSLMRVAVDKGRDADRDHDFVAEDTTAKDHADEVMRRCEEVTKMLRKTLGKHTDRDHRFGATSVGGEGGGEGKEGEVVAEEEEEYHQVEQPQMIAACGDTARYLKPYQVVGINFLMLLYRSKVSGAILADEVRQGGADGAAVAVLCIPILVVGS